MTSAEVFNCILCKETFDNKDELQVHFRKHGDPKFNESIKNKNRGQNEGPCTSDKSDDASEMVNCDVCDEVFPTISKAITHKHKVHPDHDAKYFCPWCGKLFTMKHLYNKHLQTNHEAVEATLEPNESHFRCDSCSVYFFLPAAMIYHNKFFHRQDTDLPIIGHSKKQKLCNQDLLPLYYCSFCGEEYINKVNLHKHICDDHGDENQRPTDVLRCPLCEAIFYHLDAYELHLTFHTSDDLYSETNEMNEKQMLEFSLETVPPMMERIEDLNNLPEGETDVNSIGIESFLQMAMDESHDSKTGKKVKSKKHKKHKKSKKSAITLDEFLNMNQDVFGEGLDFQGVEEVPTKVIKRQLKPKKAHTGAKFVSADLQKLQKQGIVIKMKSGSRPPSLQGRNIGQTVKVSPHVKNLTSQTKTKAIRASDEVLSKLINQSSNQIKIVKKPTQEKINSDETAVKDVVMEETKNTLPHENHSNSEIVKTDQDTNIRKNNDQHTDFTSISDTHVEADNHSNENFNTCEGNQEASVKTRTSAPEGTQDHAMSSEENTDHTSTKIKSQSVNQNEPNHDMQNTLKNIGKQITIKSVIPLHNKTQNKVEEPLLPEKDRSDDVRDKSVGGDMKDTLKHITNQITIKSVTPPTNKTQMQCKLEDPHSPDEDDNDDTADESHVIESSSDANSKNSGTLDPLRNLNSAITVKAMGNRSVKCENKNNTPTTNKNIEQNAKLSYGNIPGKNHVQYPNIKKPDESVKNKQEIIKEKTTQSSSHVLRNLSKNITIKSMSTSVKKTKDCTLSKEHNDSDFDETEVEEPTTNNNINRVDSTVAMHNNESPIHKLSPDIKIKASSHSAYPNVNVITDGEEGATGDSQLEDRKDTRNTNIQSSNNLLKHLKNITAKTVPSAKNVHQQISAQSSNQKISIAKGSNFIKKSMQKTELTEEIEIFNIDDSDDSDEAHYQKSELHEVAPKNDDFNTHGVKSTAALNAIKNMSKHVTVKSSNYQMTETKDKQKIDDQTFSDDELHADAEQDSWGNPEDTSGNKLKKMATTHVTSKPKTETYKNVFKNLGKHITVKSTNVSPSPSLRSLDQSSQDSDQYDATNDGDSDADSCNGKVKITEITEDNDASDNDIDHTTGIVTQSPDDSKSGDEFFTEEAEEFDGYEDQSKVIKTSNHNLKPTSESLLKNISKNITVKSLSERSVDSEGKIVNATLPHIEKTLNQSNLLKELSFKNIKQKPEIQNQGGVSRNKNSNKQIEAGCSSNQSVNQKVTKPSGVINAVNKEVKVKTFQSETVIEEITTTVTKTIRRVNQVNQQVYNASQTPTPAPKMVQQRNGPRIANYNQVSNKFQGITVRHSSPRVQGPKIRQAAPLRPAIASPVRPSNQIVPIRPNVNLVRPNNSPRMQIKNMPPKQTGKPLKISPNAMNNSLKRPVTEETSGHFSCFKKPKESLIPGNETSMGSSADFNYTSSSQMSKFCSTTKIVKDNSIMTNTQMKSESISQQQQINRHGNVSGLKVTKAKQVNVMERNEISASKRIALEAIEKLKKQGLLIKKPRVEEDCEPPNSDGEDSEEFQGDNE